MKTLHSRYAVYLNRRMKTVGYQFQGRYVDDLIETSDYFMEVSSYIHRNPLEAKMVTRCVDYRHFTRQESLPIFPINFLHRIGN
jgi:putative transposase